MMRFLIIITVLATFCCTNAELSRVDGRLQRRPAAPGPGYWQRTSALAPSGHRPFLFAAPLSQMNQFTEADIEKEKTELLAEDGFRTNNAEILSNCKSTISTSVLTAILYFTLVFPTILPVAPFFAIAGIDLIGTLFRCMVTGLRVFGEQPSTGITQLTGQAEGTFYLAQARQTPDSPEMLAVLAHIEGLSAGGRYTAAVYEAGVADASCQGLGKRLMTLGSSQFTGTLTGRAWLAVQDERVRLDAILGRSLVLEAADGAPVACGVVVRNKSEY